MVAREGPVRLVELVEQLFDAGEFGGGAAVGEVATFNSAPIREKAV